MPTYSLGFSSTGLLLPKAMDALLTSLNSTCIIRRMKVVQKYYLCTCVLTDGGLQ